MIQINKELQKLIKENALAFATVDNNKPHCVAVGDVQVVSKNKILIGDIYLVETAKNLKINNNAAFVVWNKDWQKNCIGYEIRGICEYFKKGKWFDKIKKIHKGFKPKGAILVTINKIKKLA